MFQNTTRKFVVGNGHNYGGYDNVPLPLESSPLIILGILSQVGNVTRKRYSKLMEQFGELQIVSIYNKIGK